MSLNSSGGNTHRVDITDSALDLNTFTWLMCIYVDNTTSNGQSYVTKGDGSTSRLGMERSFGDPTNVDCIVFRATTNATFFSTDDPRPANQRVWLAMTYSDANGINLYKGTDTAPFTQSSGTNSVGSGAIVSHASTALKIGNRSANDESIYGDVIHFSVFDVELTLAQMRQQQWTPHPTSSCVAQYHLGFSGATTQKDYAGAGLDGTITTFTVGTRGAGIPFWLGSGAGSAAAASGGSAIEATAAGVATTTATMVKATAYELTAAPAGVGASTATLYARKSVSMGDVAGVATVTVSMTVASVAEIAATPAGTSTTVVALATVRSIAANADGTSTVTVSVSTGGTIENSASASGAATVAVTVARIRGREASAAGAGVAAVAVSILKARAVSPAGAGAASVNLALVRALSAAATGVAVATVALTEVEGTTTVTGLYAAEHARAYALVSRKGAQ